MRRYHHRSSLPSARLDSSRHKNCLKSQERAKNIPVLRKCQVRIYLRTMNAYQPPSARSERGPTVSSLTDSHKASPHVPWNSRGSSSLNVTSQRMPAGRERHAEGGAETRKVSLDDGRRQDEHVGALDKISILYTLHQSTCVDTRWSV